MKKTIYSLLFATIMIIGSISVANAAAKERSDMLVEGKYYNLELVTVFVNKKEKL